MIIATNQITLADVNDGVALYTWIRYADDANGTGLSSSPTNKKYIGIAYNKPTLTPSSTPSDYTWSLIKGDQGVAGDRGADGVTYYTWIKYADTPTTGMTDNPTGKAYVGIAHNKTTATESTNYGDYQWSLIKGADGRDGVDAIIANLTNDSHVLPANSSGVVSSYGGAETTMQVFIGTSDDTNNWSFTATPSTGVTGTLTGNTYTVTSLASANDTGYVDITASRMGYVSLTSRFTLSKSKQGATGATGGTGSAGQNATAYWLVNSVPAIRKSITGVYTPTTVTFTGKSQTGTGTPTNYAGRFIVAESTDGTNFTTKYTSVSNEASRTHTPSADVVAIRVQFYLAGGTTTLLDEEIIPVVLDGATGEKGDKGDRGDQGIQGNAGQNAIMGILSNDSHVLPSDSAGNVTSYGGATTTISIYVGSSDDSSNWTVTATPSTGVTGTLSGKTYTVTGLAGANDTGFVDLTATRSGYPSVVRRFSLTKSKQGTVGATGSAGQNATSYWLVASNAAIRKSEAGAYTPSTLTMTAKSQTGTGTPTNYSGRFIIAETTDGTNWTTRYTSTANEATKTHTPTAGIVAIRVQLYLAGGTTTLLDEEIIPIVADGIKGADGANGSDGQTLYTWVKYADTPTTGMSDSPTNKTYIGLAYNKTTATKSTNYADYAWSLIKGADGVAGARGSDGTTYYTWIKYADDANGSGMSDSPTGKRFLGLAHNKTTATESNTATDYTWSPLYDNVSVGGRNFYSFVNTTISNLQNAPTVTKNHAEAPNGIRITGQQSLVGSIRLNNVINENGWWTVSFWGKANGASSLTIDVCDLGSKTLNFTTSWQKFEVSVNVTNYSAASFHFVDISNIGWINYDLKELMIEHASVASGYSPAPEDVDKSIKDVDSKVNDIYSDLKVTPVEKNELKRMWDTIKAEYTQNLALANSLTVSATSYTTAYNALNGTSPRIETDILASMTTTYTFVDTTARDTFRTQLTTYVTQREALLKAIGDKQYLTATAAKSLTDAWKSSDGTTIDGAKIRTGTLRADVVVTDFFKGRTIEGGTITLVDEGILKSRMTKEIMAGTSPKLTTFWVEGGLVRRMIADNAANGFIGFFDGDVGDFKGFMGNSSGGYVSVVTAMEGTTADTLSSVSVANLEVGTLRQTDFDGGAVVKNQHNPSSNVVLGFTQNADFPVSVPRLRVGGSGNGSVQGFAVLGQADRILFHTNNNGIITSMNSTGLYTPSLLNGWQQYSGFETFGLYKDAFGNVHIQGLIRNGTTTSGTTIALLPTSWRPASTQIFTLYTGTSTTVRIDVGADGYIRLNSSGSGSFISFAGIYYKQSWGSF